MIDADKDGLLELYVVSYEKRRSCIYSFNYEGKNLRMECFSGYSKPQYPHASEEITLVYVEDMNNDAVLDVLAASSITGTSVNVKKLYVIKREYVRGLNRYEYDLKWDFNAGGVVTDIKTADVNGDGWDEILASSLDAKVYVFGQDRELKYSIALRGGVWGIDASDMEGDGMVEIAAGFASGISLIKGRRVLWNYSTGERISDVFVGDLNGDNISEILALSGGQIYVLDINGTLLWSKRMEDLVDSWIKDVDNDGRMDILLLTEESLYSLDGEGDIQWRYSFDELSLALSIDFYNNIFVGTLSGVHHFVVDQDFLLNEKAEEAHSKAYSLYIGGNYSGARFYASMAQRMFQMVDNTEGVLRCEFIFLVTENSSAVDKREKAEEYYENAADFLAVNSFDDARYYAETALDIFLGINDKNSAMKCNLLLLDINRKEKELKKSNAFRNYNSALDYLSQNMFDKASLHAYEALRLYTELNDSDGIADCGSLLDGLILKEKRHKADSLYNLSLQSFDLEAYENASIYADEAKELYLELGEEKAAAGCDSLLNLSERYIEIALYYDFALEQYRSAHMENATLYAKKAKAIYEELNDSKGVERCVFLLSQIEESKRNAFLDYLILAAPILFFVILIVVIHLRRRKQEWN